MRLSKEKALALICKGAEEIIGMKELEEKLGEERPLKIKLGLDPTAPDIHLGHSVVLRKIKQFQDLGHEAIIIIGDFTGRIGDPTGKSSSRKQLTEEEVIANAKTYKEQLFKILDEEKTKIFFNSQWLSKLNFQQVLELAGTYTVARMLEREDFKRRFHSQQPIGIHEFFYPLMQAYDSVAIEADVEIGGTEQKFNILMGRHLQKQKGKPQQTALFMPILEGLDGVEKMSKSLNNYVGIAENPEDIVGKIMSIPDDLILRYFELVTDWHPDQINQLKQDLEAGKEHPRDVKLQLAEEICSLYYNEKQAKEAKNHFIEVVSRKSIPKDIPTIEIEHEEDNILNILKNHNIITSMSEGRRLMSQGGISLNGEKVLELKSHELKEGDILKVGKRKFFRILILG